MLIVPRRSSHALALRCVAIAADCIHVRALFLLLVVLARHGRFSSVSFRLSEEKVLISVAPNLKIDNMTLVLVIF